MPEVLLDGICLAYRWEGNPAGPVLVLSHSLGASGLMWDSQLATLGAQFRLLIPDHRGHGKSSVPDEPYRIEQFGRELIALLDQLALERVSFCGLSLGGMIGLWLGQNADDRIEKLVLCNTAAKIEDTTLLESRMKLIRDQGMEAIADDVIAKWFSPAFCGQNRDAVEVARRMLLSTSAIGYANTSAAVCQLDLRARLNEIRCPTLVVAGAHDLATPLAWNQAVADAIPQARIATLPAAHLSNIEASDEFNRVVAEFLAS